MQAVRKADNIYCGVRKSPLRGLRSFLIRDSGSEIFRQHYPVSCNKVNLNIAIPGQGMMGQICGLNGLSRLYVEVRQERIGSQQVKMLYGWGKEGEWGDLDRVRIKYILARGDYACTGFELLKRPEPILGPNQRQKSYLATSQMVRILKEGLGNGMFIRRWNVIERGSGLTFVQYHLDGVVRMILGFNGHRSVYSVMTEEDGRIIGRFYPNKAKARAKTDLLKVVVFSVNKGGWDPLVKPQIIETSPDSKDQFAKLQVKRVREFVKDEVEDGEFIDLGPIRVYQDGTSRLVLSSDLEAERNMTFSNYAGRSQMVGRLIREGNEKKVYFWTDEASRAAQEPPHIPAGHVVARLDQRKRWEIAWRGIGKLRLETERYGNFLFATVGDKLFEGDWPVRTLRRPSGLIRRAERRIRRNTMGVPLTNVPFLGPSIFSVTREIAERIKFVEFWRSQSDFKRDEAPLAARFIMARRRPVPGHLENGWFPFWAKLDQAAAFKRLIKQRIFTRGEMSLVLEDAYLMTRYEDQMYQLIDTIPLY